MTLFFAETSPVSYWSYTEYIAFKFKGGILKHFLQNNEINNPHIVNKNSIQA